MNGLNNNQTFESLTLVVDALALATRVSRHAGFRLVYFGENGNYRDSVRYLIGERLSNEYTMQKPLTHFELEALVERFVKTAHPAVLSDESKVNIKSAMPEIWAEIAG